MDIVDARALPPIPGAESMGTWSDIPATERNRLRRGLPGPFERSLEGYCAACDAHGLVAAAVTARVVNDQWGHLSNDAVFEAADADPFFLPVPAIAADHPDPRGAVAEALDRNACALIVEPGLTAPPRRLDASENGAVFRACADSGLPIYLMCGGEVGPNLSFADPLTLEAVATSFPEMRIVCIHGGWPQVQAMLGVCYRRENIWLMPDLYFPGMPGETDYIVAINTFMAHRTLFATAYPYYTVGEAVGRWAELPLAAPIVERVLHQNARELLALG